jgi:HSP90 family molecular chaperone
MSDGTLVSFSDLTKVANMAHTLDLNNLQWDASQNGKKTEVGLNQRKIIQSILAHYSTDFVVFRELIQNADDAQATLFHLEIKCDAPSSSSAEMDFQNRTITEFRMINNGNIFSETDWKRVATIADGNTDPQSVGQFGVGFFSAFSYTEEPIVASGEEYMIFVWQDDKLLSIRHKLPVEQQSKSTTIILKMRDKHVLRIESALDNSKGMNEDMSTINLAQLKAYFAKGKGIKE